MCPDKGRSSCPASKSGEARSLRGREMHIGNRPLWPDRVAAQYCHDNANGTNLTCPHLRFLIFRSLLPEKICRDQDHDHDRRDHDRLQGIVRRSFLPGTLREGIGFSPRNIRDPSHRPFRRFRAAFRTGRCSLRDLLTALRTCVHTSTSYFVVVYLLILS